MKNFHLKTGILFSICAIVAHLSVNCQYYYKDIVSTRQINETFKLYSQNKITSVKLSSFNGSTPITEGFICEQKVYYRPNKVVTYTKTSDAGESFLITVYNPQGLLVKTTDSTEESVSTTYYQYNQDKQLIQLRNETSAADKSSATTEVHNWLYNTKGEPLQLTRIKNGKDSVAIKFTLDEKGNVAEEESFLATSSWSKTYYYYDENNRLTDIVRYNAKANRLLPDYIFEYEPTGELSTMTVVPEGSNDYQKWYYKYDDTGLKAADFCYNKKNELQGKIEYEYSR